MRDPLVRKTLAGIRYTQGQPKHKAQAMGVDVIPNMISDDVLVLPSHEAPLYGLHVRLNQLIEAHNRDLRSLFEYLDQPRRAVDCFPPLFNREIDQGLG